ncbi:MAG: undecaprenyldiphospho-muramoylpentapeptide beta-N-acetylglucosaminyltransferase [Bacillota bacterium]
MRVLIAGGGTGGHIYPAVAIANRMKEEIKNVEIMFVGTKKGLESELVPKAGYPFKTITVSGFKRKLSPDTLKSFKDLFVGIVDAARVIKEFKPDLVIGTGGYVCGPVLFIASLLNIKTVIHEQNVIPGVTNRILSKFVHRILVSFEESKDYFNNSNKIVVTGNPIRKDFFLLDKEQCRKDLRISETQLVILSFGGSRGAEKLNEMMLKVIKKYNGREDVCIIHCTGNNHYENTLRDLNTNQIVLSKNIRIKEYIHDIPQYMAAADLVICRSGAITLAEITAVGLPAILIPSPYVTNNHQEYNARVLEKNGAAVLLLEKDINDKNIVELLNLLLKDKERLKEMGMKSRNLSKMNATDLIYDNIIQLLNA